MSDEEPDLPRPTPDPAFRGGLGRRLGAAWQPPGPPAGLLARVAGLAAGGTALLLVALTQI